ncbi:hypothetical protein NX059_004718 [Plenodomus lindquistii]|nr:hypothetical protein NX059_004718 [Plenodomus lindquistii]
MSTAIPVPSEAHMHNENTAFFRLSAEIRNLIYEYVFTEDQTLEVARRESDDTELVVLTNDGQYNVRTAEEVNPLRFVCRALYRETKSLIFKYNRVRFSYSSSPLYDCDDCLRIISTRNQQLVKRIDVFEYLDWFSNSGPYFPFQEEFDLHSRLDLELRGVGETAISLVCKRQPSLEVVIYFFTRRQYPSYRAFVCRHAAMAMSIRGHFGRALPPGHDLIPVILKDNIYKNEYEDAIISIEEPVTLSVSAKKQLENGRWTTADEFRPENMRFCEQGNMFAHTNHLDEFESGLKDPWRETALDILLNGC